MSVIECPICYAPVEYDDIICPCCNEKAIVIDSLQLNALTRKYADLKHIVFELNKLDFNDNYKTKAVKSTQLEIYKNMFMWLANLLTSMNIDVSTIEESNIYVDKPRMCDLKNRICTHCGDC